MIVRTLDTSSDTEFSAFLSLFESAIAEDEHIGNMTYEPTEWSEKPLEYRRDRKIFAEYYVALEDGKIIGYARLAAPYPQRLRLRHNYSL
jgi:hypothetical protein